MAAVEALEAELFGDERGQDAVPGDDFAKLKLRRGSLDEALEVVDLILPIGDGELVVEPVRLHLKQRAVPLGRPLRELGESSLCLTPRG